MALTWQDLDDMVEGDPLELRDRAWAEIKRLNALAEAVETYLSGGRTTDGLRGLYAAREARHGSDTP